MSPELEQAVRERVELGHSKQQISAELQAAGYDEGTIEAIYNSVHLTATTTIASATVNFPKTTDIFKESWRFMLSQPLLVGIVAIPTLLMNLAAAGMQLGWITPSAGLIGGAVLSFFVLLFIQFLLQLTVAKTALDTIQGQESTVSASWRWAVASVWSWIWIATLTSVVVFGGSLLLIIPGLIISVYVMFALYVYIDEGAKGMQALQRSRELVYGNFWNVVKKFIFFIFLLLLVMILVGIVVGFASEAVNGVQNGIPELVFAIIDALLTGAATLLCVYFVAKLYIALKSQVVQSLPLPKSYSVLGWFGAIVFLIMTVFGAFAMVAFVEELQQNGFDFEAMYDTAAVEIESELSPQEQADFEAFMEKFGEELDSY